MVTIKYLGIVINRELTKVTAILTGGQSVVRVARDEYLNRGRYT